MFYISSMHSVEFEIKLAHFADYKMTDAVSWDEDPLVRIMVGPKFKIGLTKLGKNGPDGSYTFSLSCIISSFVVIRRPGPAFISTLLCLPASFVEIGR